MAAKHVVIIGCGPAGLNVANELAGVSNAGKVQITIIDKKDHVDMCVPHPRSMVNAVFADEVLVMHGTAFKATTQPKVVQVSEVTSVGDGAVTVRAKGGVPQTINADAIVIATGSSYGGAYIKNDDGLDKSAWLQKIGSWRQAAANSKHILIIGGGVTGVEVAGELATEHPSCKITIVHGGKWLCNVSEKFHKNCISSFDGLPGTVEVLCDDRVDAEEALSFANGPQTYTTQTSKTIANVDMVLKCTGVSPNSSFLDANKLDAKKFIVVDGSLQAPSLTSAKCPVFAVGDVTSVGYGRVMVAEAMGKACAKNLKNLVAGKPLNTKVYNVVKAPFLPVLISVGRTQGVANVPFNGKMLARNIKAPGLLANMIWPNHVKGFKLSAAAKAPSPLTLGPVVIAN
mmetsp:Transcript_69377/g.112601  ORF Transcript_69377/g.112601 Transcript_69377/m.112601 type:complete len:400 (-) Transcript_69377:68-1267(-)|eukprot:CAMPEP_0179447078 /NCGR_PEP_ID=MMETSP0799-20121207/30829_1 /TAXON_ID=46947 /ORGANISM="Geminigera cryophila, Strain CCMP2564" /LENGTH=399 /DNA_ID=CAMNT_0021237371 /DNA_START=114 /DNA_END=1313 /DNA_ORIENTATION=+